MAQELVLTFERTNIYQIELAGRALTALAEALDIPRKDLMKAIKDEDLSQYDDEILAFIVDNPDKAELTEEGDAESLEIEYING